MCKTVAYFAGVRCIVTLECTEARAEGGTPSRYTTQKVSCSLMYYYQGPRLIEFALPWNLDQDLTDSVLTAES